jgi:hypothetical protein
MISPWALNNGAVDSPFLISNAEGAASLLQATAIRSPPLANFSKRCSPTFTCAS